MRSRWLTYLFCLVATHAQAAKVAVEIDGLAEEQRKAVEENLELREYEKRDIKPAELRSAYKEAEAQIRLALEPFGFYDVEVDSSLTGDEQNGWNAKFTVRPGEPAIVNGPRSNA